MFKNLTNIINNENFGTELKNKVMILGVPSYTSGAQTLKGTTVNLNNKLIYINTKLKIITLLYLVVNKNKESSFKLVKPVIP